MPFVEVLEGEYLVGVVCGERSPDPVRAVGCLAVLRALDEIHLGSMLLQPLVAHSVQDEPRRVGHDDHASRLLGHLPELLGEDVAERPKRKFEPAPEHFRLVGLDRGQQVGRIEACGKRAPPRLDNRRSQSCRGSGWKLRAECAVGEQTLPAFLQLSSAAQRIGLRSDSRPLRRHRSCDDSPLDRAEPPGERLASGPHLALPIAQSETSTPPCPQSDYLSRLPLWFRGGGTITTGRHACSATSCEKLPFKSSCAPVRPREPTTIRAASISSAIATTPSQVGASTSARASAAKPASRACSAPTRARASASSVLSSSKSGTTPPTAA